MHPKCTPFWEIEFAGRAACMTLDQLRRTRCAVAVLLRYAFRDEPSNH